MFIKDAPVKLLNLVLNSLNRYKIYQNIYREKI